MRTPSTTKSGPAVAGAEERAGHDRVFGTRTRLDRSARRGRSMRTRASTTQAPVRNTLTGLRSSS